MFLFWHYLQIQSLAFLSLLFACCPPGNCILQYFMKERLSLLCAQTPHIGAFLNSSLAAVLEVRCVEHFLVSLLLPAASGALENACAELCACLTGLGPGMAPSCHPALHVLQIACKLAEQFEQQFFGSVKSCCLCCSV